MRLFIGQLLTVKNKLGSSLGNSKDGKSWLSVLTGLASAILKMREGSFFRPAELDFARQGCQFCFILSNFLMLRMVTFAPAYQTQGHHNSLFVIDLFNPRPCLFKPFIAPGSALKVNFISS